MTDLSQVTQDTVNSKVPSAVAANPEHENANQTTVPDASWPDLEKQITDLAGKASNFAKEGINVSKASALLDELSSQLSQGTVPHGIGVNQALNTIRYELTLSLSEHKFSRGKGPYWLALYEFCLIGVLVLFFFAGRHSMYGTLSTGSPWLLPFVWGIAAMSAMIGAIVHTLYVLYRGRMTGSVGANAVMWYLLKPVTSAIIGGFTGLATEFLLNDIANSGKVEQLAILFIAFLSGMNDSFSTRILDKASEKLLPVQSSSKQATQATNRTPVTSASNTSHTVTG